MEVMVTEFTGTWERVGGRSQVKTRNEKMWLCQWSAATFLLYSQTSFQGCAHFKWIKPLNYLQVRNLINGIQQQHFGCLSLEHLNGLNERGHKRVQFFPSALNVYSLNPIRLYHARVQIMCQIKFLERNPSVWTVSCESLDLSEETGFFIYEVPEIKMRSGNKSESVNTCKRL